jgi:uncharacterized Rmd1/YagE family protein
MNLGSRFEVRAVHVGERIDVKGLEPRLSAQLPVMIAVGAGCAALLRAGAVVLFGVDPVEQEKLIADLGERVQQRSRKTETERATVRVGEQDAIEPDGIVMREVTLERLQVIAVILGKSVILARQELDLADAFNAIEPLALRMKSQPARIPWSQDDLVRQIGGAMFVEQQLVGSAEVLEKPDLLWDNPELDRLYARLEDEYELRERHAALERKLAVVARAAQTMLDLHQARRSLKVEYYIIGLIAIEVVLAVIQMALHR